MKVIVMNFTGPVKTRMILWLKELGVSHIVCFFEKTDSMMKIISKYGPDLIFLDTDHTTRLVSTVRFLRTAFPAVAIIGLTENPSSYKREKLLQDGLYDLLPFDAIVEKDKEYFKSIATEQDKDSNGKTTIN